MFKKVKLPGVIYEMTTLCNLKCKYCYNYWKKENDNTVDIEKYNPKKTLKQFMKSVKCNEVTFSRWRTNNEFPRIIRLYYVC